MSILLIVATVIVGTIAQTLLDIALSAVDNLAKANSFVWKRRW